MIVFGISECLSARRCTGSSERIQLWQWFGRNTIQCVTIDALLSSSSLLYWCKCTNCVQAIPGYSLFRWERVVASFIIKQNTGLTCQPISELLFETIGNPYAIDWGCNCKQKFLGSLANHSKAMNGNGNGICCSNLSISRQLTALWTDTVRIDCIAMNTEIEFQPITVCQYTGNFGIFHEVQFKI